MKDVMVDLETLDNVASAAIVSIGAVECDLTTGELGDKFYKIIDLDNQRGTVSTSTITWWMDQSEQAKDVFTAQGKVNIKDAILSFSKWIHSLKASNQHIRLWGNGASFDNAILRQTFRTYNCEFPTEFWNDRDMRTIVGFYPKQLQETWRRNNLRKGTHHNALDDAIHQVRYCSDILSELGVKELY